MVNPLVDSCVQKHATGIMFARCRTPRTEASAAVKAKASSCCDGCATNAVCAVVSNLSRSSCWGLNILRTWLPLICFNNTECARLAHAPVPPLFSKEVDHQIVNTVIIHADDVFYFTACHCHLILFRHFSFSRIRRVQALLDQGTCSDISLGGPAAR